MLAASRLAIAVLVVSAGLGLGLTAVRAEEGRVCSGTPAPRFPAFTTVPPAPGTSTVATPFGEAELPAAPKAALGMYTTDVDMLIWLGYPLAARQPIRGGNGYVTFPCFFPEAPLRGVEPFGNYPEYNYEAILAAGPDFILNGLGYDKDVNARLPQIAPTYSVDAFDGRSWREHFRETAEALGRLDRYEAWVALYEARLAEVRGQIKAHADAVVAPLTWWQGTYNSGCYTGVECSVFSDLGLTIFAGALEDDGKGVELSPEEVGQLKGIDYVFTTMEVGDDGLAAYRERLAAAASNPIWAELGFVRQQHIVPYEMEMVYGSPSGQLAFLEVVAKALSE